MKKKRYDNQKLIPVAVIKAAANGDETLKSRLENKLIQKILEFKVR